MTRRPEGIVLDTNLLLLWIVARTDASLLGRFKRVQAFTPRDVEALRHIVEPFKRFVTTSHILSETSNFIGQAPPHRQSILVDELKEFWFYT